MSIVQRSSLLVASLVSGFALVAHAAEPAPPAYEKHVAPFFKTYCIGCHDGGEESKGGLNLLTHKGLMAGGDGGEVIVSGKSEESRLIQMLLGAEEPKMPPKGSKQPRPEEIALVKRWVDLGAKPPVLVAPDSAEELSLPKIAPKVAVTPAIAAVAYSPDGRWLAAARHRELLLIDANTGVLSRTLTGAENPINAIAFSPDSRLVAAAEGFPSVVGKVRLWQLTNSETPSASNPKTEKPQSADELRTPHSASRTLSSHTDSIYALAFSPDGTQLVTASYDKLLIAWEVATGAEQHTLKHHTGGVFGLAYSPDGKALASVSADQTVKLWNAASGQRLLTLTEATKPLAAVAFHPQGREFAAGGSDKMIRVYEWNGTVARLKRSTFAHNAGVLALAYDREGTTLFSAGEDRRIKAWDVGALRERFVYEQLADWPLSLAISPNGRQLAVGLYNGELLLFDAHSPKRLRAVEFARAEVPRESWPGFSEPHDARPALHQHTNPQSSALPAFVRFAVGALVGQPQAPPPAAQEPKPNPPAPRFDAISPRTVVRGQKLRLTLSGQNIAAADRLLVSQPEVKVSLLPSDPMNANQAFCEVEIPADLAIGNVSLRLRTPLGTAGTKSFYVGPFAETGEKEDNNELNNATPALLPTTFTGTIDRRGDRDVWSFDARTGEELVFVLAAPSLGSALQGRLTLSDDQGRLLKSVVRQPERSELVLGHKFVTAGRFFLQVEDRDNSGSGNHFYVVHAGTFPWVTGVWPLGIRASDQGAAASGEITAIDITGFNLLPDTKVHALPGAATRSLAPFASTGRTLNSARYEASSFPEFIANGANDAPDRAQEVPIPGAVSGRLVAKDSGFGIRDSGDGESPPLSKGGPGGVAPQGTDDRNQATPTPHSELRTPNSSPLTTHHSTLPPHYSFTAKRGDRLTIETIASRIGSPADTDLEILDAHGKPVPRYTLRAISETSVVLRDHDSRGRGIRLQNWDDLQPDDFVMIGGEVIRVQSLPLGPDADVQFAERGGRRLGWFGTTPEAHAINTAAYKVEVHPPGVTFPPNGMPLVPLNWRSDDAPGLGTDSEILFDVPADGTYVVRVRDVRELASDDFVYRLVIRPRREDFRISLDPENPNVPRGGILPVTVNVDRLEGFDGPIEVRVEGLPEGITATTTHIGPNRNSGILTFSAAADLPPLARGGQGGSPASEPAAPVTVAATTSAPFRVVARATIDGQPVERTTTPSFGGHEVTVTSPPDVLISVEPTFAEISPGQELRFTATIERRNAFKGRIPIEVLNLPHGIRVLDVGLNGVLVNENETSRSFVVTCDRWAEPGAVQFYAAARVEAKTERHASSPLRLEVKGTSSR